MKNKCAHIIILLLLTLLSTPMQGKFKVADYNKDKAKEIIDTRVKRGILEIVEGIWESSNGKIYAIERFEDERFPENIRYRVIQLEGKNSDPGMVDYFLEMTNYDEYYRIWGNNPFSLTNEPVGRECYISFTQDSFSFKQQIQTITFTRKYPQINYQENSGTISLGSGFAITPNGYIVTNHHVIANAQNIVVTGVNGSFEQGYNARLVVTDPKNDLAIIKIEDSVFTTFGEIPYNIRNNDPIEGEYCFAIGYPAANVLGVNPKTTAGIISATTDSKFPAYCQMSVAIESGSSGSPLFDSNGNVLAVNVAKYNDYFPNLAVKTSYLMRLIGQCDELKDLSMTPATPGRQLPEIVATNKGFVVLIFINYNPFGEQKPFYVLDEVEKKDDPMSNAEKLYSEKRYKEAISALTDILMNDPQNSDAYYLRGCSWASLVLHDNAIIDYNQALHYFDSKKENIYPIGSIYRNKAVSQMFNQDYEEALKNLELALKDTPDDGYNDVLNGVLNYHVKRYENAIKIFSEITHYTGLQDIIYYYRGLCYFAIGETPKARADMQCAARFGSKDASDWLQQYP